MRLLLASASPRRAHILQELGLEHQVVPSPVDDGELTPPPGTSAVAWTIAMAYLKARAAIDALPPDARKTTDLVLGADTACELDGRIIGKPASAADAANTLRAMRGRTQRVVTGVALVCPAHPRTRRLLVADVAQVTFGALDGQAVDAYTATGQWQGKAGGYNLSERLADGWPIVVSGDPSTVVGLPAQRLGDWLSQAMAWGAA